MRVAEDAGHLVAAHSKAQIYFSYDVFFGDGRPETGPTRAGIEFRTGTKERVAATDAAVQPRIVVVVVDAAKGSLGVCFACDVKFIGTQQVAPFSVTLNHFCYRFHA